MKLKRLLSVCLVSVLVLSLFTGCAGNSAPQDTTNNEVVTEPDDTQADKVTDTETTNPPVGNEIVTEEETKEDKAAKEEAMLEELLNQEVIINYPDVKGNATGFVHVENGYVFDGNGDYLEIRGIALGNSVYNNPTKPNYKHHTEDSYKELAELGFNSVRFYINYGILEKDSDPYNYKEAGWEWLDKNVEWAKKHGIGIIFNMHYPQGGYQSGGDGMALWLDVSNQDRLTALWTAIAERYADEPTVWGYSLINEPYLPLTESFDATRELYNNVINRLAKSIREVSPNQILIAEEILAMTDMRDNSYVNKSDYTSELCFPKIDDDNVMYEFHYYNPFNFTHQGASWVDGVPLGFSYPSSEIGGADYTNTWVTCKVADFQKEINGWKYYKSVPVFQATNYNLTCAALNAKNLGKDGIAYFDDIQITEVDPEGNETVIRTYTFDDDVSDFSAWSADGSGKMTHCKTDGFNQNGCAKVEGTLQDFTASASRLYLKEGYKYYISGYIKLENTKGAPRIRLDHAHANNVYSMDKEYLEAALMPYVEYAKANNVALYLGEFGVINYGFKENRGGVIWVADMLELLRKYNIAFNYHTYHETNFGLYLNYDSELPAMPNKPLYEIFKARLQPQNN